MVVTQIVVDDSAINNEKELQTQALTVVEQAKSIVISNQETYDRAAHLLLDVIKPMRKKWADYWGPLKETAYRSYKGILDKFNEGDKPLELAEGQVKTAIQKWDYAQEQIRQEQQRKAQEEVERLERDRRLQEAVEAEAAGVSEEQVQAIMDAPAIAVAPLLASTYTKAAGISTRENWKARVVDMKKLAAAVAKGLVPVTYILPNEQALNARAKADKATLNIPGVQAYNDPIVAGRPR